MSDTGLPGNILADVEDALVSPHLMRDPLLYAIIQD